MNEQTITLAGGCFWGMEELFRKQSGVISTRVGYTGGKTQSPTYEDICKGDTDHAEAIEVIFDDQATTLRNLLIFFFKMHDSTTQNRQGNDIGTQYRSAIFYNDETQKDTAQALITGIDAAKFLPAPIVTQLTPASTFHEAEDYHQDYLEKNPNGYTCHFARDDWNL